MESIYSKHRPGSSDELYLKLKDGDNVKLRIFSEPAIVVFKEGQRPRYSWVVINHDNKKAQVFNGGISIYNQIADLVEDWGSPTEFDIRIKRSGSGQFDTEYSVTPVKEATTPTKEQEAEAEKIDLINASKGKWLADYEADGELPPPVSNEPEETGQDKARAQADKLRTKKDTIIEDDGDEPINLEDIPFN